MSVGPVGQTGAGRAGLVLSGARPEHFARHVEAAARSVAGRPEHQRLVFVKSWNEWAEGNYLEPDAAFGHGWLRALGDGLARAQAGPVRPGAQRSTR